jgi:hypothetical protein
MPSAAHWFRFVKDGSNQVILAAFFNLDGIRPYARLVQDMLLNP